MRLLHTKALDFKEFFEAEAPQYAILSHRWGVNEVPYDDLASGTAWKQTSGYQKIENACGTALSLGYRWIWIDTCCIDKTSSAELSEAINSMFEWYRGADACLAYLNDVDEAKIVTARQRADSLAGVRNALAGSSWFTRGWTLQELLAPANVIFYDKKWRRLGTKLDLASHIGTVTGIGIQYLCGQAPIDDACVAERMCWASRRTTTRPEDMAYCLLGIFNINMPLLYGEGRRAFFRLQIELMAKLDDESIFAWLPNLRPSEDEAYGMLATSPTDFLFSGNIRKLESRSRKQPYTFTNRGLALQWESSYQASNVFGLLTSLNDEIILPLACKTVGKQRHGQNHRIAVILHRIGESWYRIKCDNFHFCASHPSTARVAPLKSRPLIYVEQPDLNQRGGRQALTVRDLASRETDTTIRTRRMNELRALGLGVLTLTLMQNPWTLTVPHSPRKYAHVVFLESMATWLTYLIFHYHLWLVWKNINESRYLSVATTVALAEAPAALTILNALVYALGGEISLAGSITGMLSVYRLAYNVLENQ